MSLEPKLCPAEEVPNVPRDDLGLFLLDILSFLEPNEQRVMQAICPLVRYYQELMIDRDEFGLVWTTSPSWKINQWVRHGGGHGSAESGRILLGVSETEHWATSAIVRREIPGTYNIMAFCPVRINHDGRRRALIVNPGVIADEGLVPQCVSRNDNGDIVIGNGFLRGVAASSVWFVGAEDVVSIGDDFLRDSQIQSVCFYGLTSLTSIGSSFLHGCTSLTTVSFEGLRNVTRIAHYFLRSCTSLTSVSFKGLSSLTSIGLGFLHGCTSLTYVSFEGLRSLTSLGSASAVQGSFLYGCTSLKASGIIALSPFRQRFKGQYPFLAPGANYSPNWGEDGNKCCLVG